ncbi:hypothetical protein ACFVT2_00190 [Streptomyces sp. NPDC058000]|uniref:hypothetical protein n=1 Tax=Streptomyces sp. NPDC058000 TaxID=3346299 RepID=UPI0036EF1C4D
MSWRKPEASECVQKSTAPGKESHTYAPVSLGEIKELAGVGRPTVSNWRRRHSRAVLGDSGESRHPFPDPIPGAGSESKPLFDASEIADWLDLRPLPDAEPDDDGRLPTYGDRFRRALRLRGLVALKHSLGSAATLISQALAVIAMSAEGKDWIPEYLPEGLLDDHQAAGPDVVRAALELMDEIGAPGWAADALLGLDDEGLEIAKRLESDLVMDVTPRGIVELVAALIGPNEGGPGQRSTISLCAGLGELLLGMGGGPYEGLRGHGELVAVEPDPSLRKLLHYRLLSYEAGSIDVCASPADLDTLDTWDQLPDEGPHGFSDADIVLADPPYVPGERERDVAGPLWWAEEAVRRLKPSGRAFVVVPAWTLSRTRGTGPTSVATPTISARDALLERGCVEAIIQLPRRIHPFRTGAEYVLLVLRPPSDPRPVLLVDADRIAQRTGGKGRKEWIDQVVRLARAVLDADTGTELSPEAVSDPQDARHIPVRADGAGEEQLLDARSILPAHRLAAPEVHVDHFDETLTARRAVAAAMPQLRDWIGTMGIVKRRTPVRHRKLDEHLRAGQLRLLNGHRIKETDITNTGLPVIGREEMLGTLPVGARRIALEDLSAYPSAKITEQGDILLLAEHGVRCHVDATGGCVLLSPVQGLRIAAYRSHLRDVAEGEQVRPDTLWMRPHSLARLLQAPRNQHRTSGSLVRRVSVRDMDLPQLPPDEVAELEEILAETERLRADARRQLEALDSLAERVSAGVADGDLALRRR